jgi:hypothetical protein
MTTIPHEPARVIPEKRNRAIQLLVPEMWASLAIAVMWFRCCSRRSTGPTSPRRPWAGPTRASRPRSSWRSSPSSARGSLHATASVADRRTDASLGARGVLPVHQMGTRRPTGARSDPRGARNGLIRPCSLLSLQSDDRSRGGTAPCVLNLSCGRVCGVAELPLPPARHCVPAHTYSDPVSRAGCAARARGRCRAGDLLPTRLSSPTPAPRTRGCRSCR